MVGRNVPLRFAASIAVYSGLIVAVALLLNTGSRWLQFSGGALAAVLVACWLVLPILDARRAERHVAENPESLKNDAIGEEVTALARFRRDGSSRSGFVALNGETWRARCAAEHVPEAGERLCVSGRNGLTLEVRQVGDSR